MDNRRLIRAGRARYGCRESWGWENTTDFTTRYKLCLRYSVSWVGYPSTLESCVFVPRNEPGSLEEISRHYLNRLRSETTRYLERELATSNARGSDPTEPARRLKVYQAVTQRNQT